MKSRTILFLLFLLNSTSSQSDRQCLHWFPEPVSYRMPVEHSQLTREFEIIDDFLFNRDENRSNQIVEDYVIRVLNSGESGGYGDMVSIVFGELPTLRQLWISIFCIILSVIIFIVIWKLGLFEVFDLLGILLRFDQYRSGLTVIPIFCCLGLLILTSNLRTSSENVAQGIVELELKQDERFMPIHDRVARKLAMVPCLFERDFERNGKKWRVVDRYLNRTVNRAMFDELYKKVPNPVDLFRSVPVVFEVFIKPINFLNSLVSRKSPWELCQDLSFDLAADWAELESQLGFTELQSEVTNLEAEYIKIILEALKISIPVTRKAIGSIGEFVQEYHDKVLLIPRISIIDFYEKFMETAVGVTVLAACTLTVLMVLEVEFRKKWSKFFAGLTVPVTLFFTIISLFLFGVLITRITFTVLIQQQVLKNNFEIFKKANPVIISENGWNRSINYGELLDVDSTPASIEGDKLFKSSRKFNETVEKLVKIMSTGYEEYVETSCRKVEETIAKFEKVIEESECKKLDFLKDLTKTINSTRNQICTYSQFLQNNPLNQTWISETAYSKWVKVLVPLKGLPIIRNSSVEMVRDPMQTYLVFENPSKKLRPTVLENLLDMAVRIVSMAPLFFVITIYFMCILPMLMGETEEDSGDSGDQKMSTSTSKSKSKSKSSSDEKSPKSPSKSKTGSNEK